MIITAGFERMHRKHAHCAGVIMINDPSGGLRAKLQKARPLRQHRIASSIWEGSFPGAERNVPCQTSGHATFLNRCGLIPPGHLLLRGGRGLHVFRQHPVEEPLQGLRQMPHLAPL